MHRAVLLLMYDLPAVSSDEKKELSKFRRNIKILGFVPMQESIYVKLLRHYSNVKIEVERVESIKPSNGLVQVLPLYLAEFKRLNTVTGDGFDTSLFSDDIVVL